MAPTLPLLHFLQVSGFRLQHSIILPSHHSAPAFPAIPRSAASRRPRSAFVAARLHAPGDTLRFPSSPPGTNTIRHEFHELTRINSRVEAGTRMAPTLPLLHFLQVSGFRLQHSAFVRLNIFLDLILPRRKTVFVNTIASDPLDGLAALLDERNLSPAARPPSLRWARLWHFTVPVDSRIRNSCIRERPAATDQAEESARRSNEGGHPRPGEATRRRPACLRLSRIPESPHPPSPPTFSRAASTSGPCNRPSATPTYPPP